MCGIAGFVNRRGMADRAFVDKQLKVLEHRGPDAVGVFTAGPAAIGQNRLAIIDVEGGDPPITSANGRVGVVLNGEIYNFIQLRDELERQGHRFTTRCDTEVIAHLGEHLDPVALARRLHGMFGFALWDSRDERLVLGRDRLGKKPLYYWVGSGTFVFASEIKGLLEHPGVRAELDPDAIPAYLTFGYVPSPRTFYQGIHSVPPGHVLVLDADLGVHLEPYWEPRVPGAGGPDRLDLSMDEAAAETRRRLRTAVEDRLVADVPLGAFLSGGIDSSAIVGLMAGAMGEPVRTFTIGFEDTEGFDERVYARQVAERFGTEHTEFVVQPKAVDLVERLVWHHDQPFGDSSAIPTYLLSELTAGHVTVALSGDGGDELFGGYERFAAGLIANRYARLPAPARRSAAGAVSTLGRVVPARSAKVQRFLRNADAGLPGALRSWISYVPDDLAAQLVPDASRWHVEDYQRIWDRTAGAHPLDRILDLNLRTYLLDDLLPKVDRTSMAHGLEVRSPFLDHELVDFAFRLPPSTKVRGMSLKRVLKTAVADLLPPELLNRPKHGFGVPLDRWFREDLAGYASAILGSPTTSLRAHVDGDALDTILAEHISGRVDRGHALWTVLTLEVFLRSRGW
jgi:asparagine synthase (glutamine-hydrolysing)